jgi:hypothetical protein
LQPERPARQSKIAVEDEEVRMSTHPVKRAQRALREVDSNAVEVMPPANPFFTFRYSHTEISAVGGKARVKSRQTCLEDGKLTTETFEGDIDRTAYDRMVGDAQRHFLDQTALFLKSFWLLPFSRNPPSDRD